MYCENYCEFYDKCSLNQDACVKCTYDQVLRTLTPRENKVIRMMYGIDNQKENVSGRGVRETEMFSQEEVEKIRFRAMRKLKHPSRTCVLQSASMCVTLFSNQETSYSKLWRAVFEETAPKEQLHRWYLDVNAGMENEASNRENPGIEKSNVENLLYHRNTRIEELDFSIRTFNCLIRGGIMTIGDLIDKTEDEIKRIRNMCRKSYEEIIQKLEAIGLSLTKDERMYMCTGENLISRALAMTLDELDLSAYAIDCLRNAEIYTVEDIVKKTYDEISAVEHLDESNAKEVVARIKALGLSLKS